MDSLDSAINKILGEQPQQPEEPPTAPQGQGETQPRADEPDRPGRLRESSQLALAEVVAPLLAQEVRYLPETEEYYLWRAEEGRWRASPAGEVLPRLGALIRQVARAQPRALDDRGKERPSPQAAWALKQLSKKGLHDVLGLASALPLLQCTVEDFDQDPHLLLCKNGVVDLRTGELSPAQPHMMLSRRCPVAYQADSKVEDLAPRFLRFLEEIFAGEHMQETIAYLQKVIGYAATGHVREHKFWVIHGRRGRNGKTTFLSTCRNALGPEIAAPASARSFLTCSDGRPIRSDLAALVGKRLVVTDEAPPDAELSTNLKSVTGGGRITAKFEHGRPFDYQPRFKVLIDGNYCPSVRTGDEAMRKRMVAVELFGDFSRSQEKDLEVKLLAEKAGVLRWIVEGAVRYHQEGLQTPKHLEAAGQEQREQDPMEQFLADRCRVRQGASVASSALYAAYRSYMTDQGYEPREIKGRDRFLKDLPFRKQKVGRTRSVLGIALEATETRTFSLQVQDEDDELF